eukprot:g45074.t1
MRGMDRQSLFPGVGKPKTRGHEFKVREERYNQDLRGNFFMQRVEHVWNELPDKVVEAAESQKKKQKDDDSDEFDDDDAEAGTSYQQQGMQQQQNFVSSMNQSSVHPVTGAPGIPPGMPPVVPGVPPMMPGMPPVMPGMPPGMMPMGGMMPPGPGMPPMMPGMHPGGYLKTVGSNL